MKRRRSFCCGRACRRHRQETRIRSLVRICSRRRRRRDEPIDLVTLATRKFESLEQFIALKLIELSKAQQRLQEERSRHHHRRQSSSNRSGKSSSNTRAAGNLTTTRETTKGSSREKIMRGLKIGGTAVAAGTLFAITGGLGTYRCLCCQS